MSRSSAAPAVPRRRWAACHRHRGGAWGRGGGSEPGGGVIIDVVCVVPLHRHCLRLAEGAADTAGIRAMGGKTGCRCHPVTCHHPSRLLMGHRGDTHPQHTSMATRPASRAAKRMVRMEVRAIMAALCPRSVRGMLFHGVAGEGAGCAPRCVCGQPVCDCTVQTRCALARCRQAVPCLSFPTLLAGQLNPEMLVLSIQPLQDHPAPSNPRDMGWMQGTG